MAFSAAFAALQQRGVFSAATPHCGARLCALLGQRPAAAAAAAPPLSVYAGFDPTAPSLHLGHVGVLVALLRLQRAGLRPIALVGGATALIGDPTGRSADRPQLAREAVAANAARLRALLEPLLGSEGSSSGGGAAPAPAVISTPSATTRAPAPLGCLVVDNAEYYQGMDVLHFMRDVGSHFRLSQLLARESVRGRMGWGGTAAAAAAEGGGADAAGAPAAGMSYTEFSYSLFQAHDFWVLHQRHGAVLQIGGSDQWGNITAGVELIRRRLGSAGAAGAGADAGAGAAAAAAAAHGAVVPLLTNAAGKKFGKSDAGSAPLWLDAALTSHHALWQYLQGVEDGEVLALLRSLTLVEEEELVALEAGLRQAPHLKAAQQRLADEVVGWLRGPQAVAEARRTARLLFAGSAAWGAGSEGAGSSSSDASDASGGGGGGAFLAQRAAFATLRHSDLEALARAGGVARAVAPPSRALGGAYTVLDALVALGLVKSRSEARRLVEGGGVYWNWERVKAPRGLGAGDFVQGRSAVVCVGRKRTGVLLLQEEEEAGAGAGAGPAAGAGAR